MTWEMSKVENVKCLLAPCLTLRNLSSITGSRIYLITTANKVNSESDDKAALRRG